MISVNGKNTSNPCQGCHEYKLNLKSLGDLTNKRKMIGLEKKRRRSQIIMESLIA
jgi:hypothetical protein